ncbi:MAG: histidine phosphatase family protein [Oscillospiraceae bacterium]|nr:histidine phosphatase family protein [Oscillospiraceae bacterium]
MRLLLLRHGATPGNLKKQYIGSTDEPLASQGVEQAKERAKTLPPVEKIWVSPMHRARHTADLFYPDAPRVYLEGLREMGFGDCEGKTWEEINDPSIFDGWFVEDPQAGFPGGETLGDFVQRTTDALQLVAEQVQAEDISTGAVVAHGGVLMALMSQHGVPARSNYFDWQSTNCGGFDTDFDPETLTLTLRVQLGENNIW